MTRPGDDSDARAVTGEPGEPPRLAEAVRARLVTLASDTLGTLGVEETPASLRPFRLFTPAGRARHAAGHLLAALDNEPAFRQRVAALVAERHPDISGALAGDVVHAVAPADIAAVAYLVRPRGWEETVRTAQEELSREQRATDGPGADDAVRRLQGQLATARTKAREDADRLRAELRAAKDEISSLRHRLRDARAAAKASAEASVEAAEALRRERADFQQAQSAADAETRRLRSRLADAEAAVDTARRAAKEGRSIEDLRLRLLLDTVIEATQGLRRELALAPTDLRPADAVAARRPDDAGVADVRARASEPDDPALLDHLLALPQAHLVVDGYNVTKTGYGALPLEVQRQRLLGGLGALAARSGAEVTVCFDGAALDARVVVAAPRGVRVLFSEPGETADELIRRLVRAEPSGRPVVVVSTDREVADGVRAAGARAVPATALLRRLDRG